MTDFDKTCFVIMPFGEEDTPERTHNDIVFSNIKKAILECDKELICKRADDVNKPGTIIDDIIKDLYNSAFVVADLSMKNPNVMYELGIRHSLKENTILLSEKDTVLPFDLGGERTIFYDYKNKFKDKIPKLKKSLLEIIEDDNHKDSRVLKVIEPLINTDKILLETIDDYRKKAIQSSDEKFTNIYAPFNGSQYLLEITMSFNKLKKTSVDFDDFKEIVRLSLQEFTQAKPFTPLNYSETKAYQEGFYFHGQRDEISLFVDFNINGVYRFNFLCENKNNQMNIEYITFYKIYALYLGHLFFKRLAPNNSYLFESTLSKIKDFSMKNSIEYQIISMNNNYKYEQSVPISYRKDYSNNSYDNISDFVPASVKNVINLFNYKGDSKKLSDKLYKNNELEFFNN